MTAMRVIRTILLAFAVAIAAAPAVANDANPAASAFMQSLANSAIQQLTDPTVSQGERRARFHQLLDAHFDMAAITKFILGRYWRTATEDQRTEFRRLFEDFLVQTYTARFAEYHGGGFEVTGSTVNGDITIVQMKVHLPAADNARVDWHLRAAGNSFRIVDIVVEGISMAVTQRSE